MKQVFESAENSNTVDVESDEKGSPDFAGGIQSYISAAQKMPMLTLEREQALAKRVRDHADESAVDELVRSHLRLVISIARRNLGYGIPHADLIQEGSIGLMKAINRFDPDRGVRLAPYAMPWIRSSINLYAINNFRTIKITTTKAHMKMFFNMGRYKQNKTGTMTCAEVSELAQILNIPESDVREMECRLHGGEISMDGAAADDTWHPGNFLPANNAEPTEIIENKRTDLMQSEGLSKALEKLDPRSRRIVEARWINEREDGTFCKLYELAEEFSVSNERIRQIETVALRKMRGTLSAYA